MGRKDL